MVPVWKDPSQLVPSVAAPLLLPVTSAVPAPAAVLAGQRAEVGEAVGKQHSRAPLRCAPVSAPAADAPLGFKRVI